MKINRSQIPEEGLRPRLKIAMSSLRRVVEQHGQQSGQLEAELFLRNRGASTWLEGTAGFSVTTACQWCLDPVNLTLQESFQEVLEPRSRLNEMGEDLQLTEGDLDISFIDGNEIDLTALVEDQALLMIPAQACAQDEHGMCTYCGRKVANLLRLHPDDDEEHPFAQLKHWLT